MEVKRMRKKGWAKAAGVTRLAPLLAAGIVFLVTCGEDEGDDAVPLVKGEAPDAGPGNLIAFSDGAAIYYCDEDGGNVTPVTGYGYFPCKNPSWSPAGDFIAYDVGHSIYVISKGGGPATFVAEGDRPAWSPRGDIIAYKGRGKYNELWAFNLKTGERALLTDKCYGEHCWAPEGEEVIFIAPDPKAFRGPEYIWYVSLQNPGVIHIVREIKEAYGATDPDWGAGGEWVAAAFGGVKGRKYEIWLINVKTGDTCRVSREPDFGPEDETVGAMEPSWSEDGEWVFFMSDCRGFSGTGIYRIRVRK
jgi:Tol biopolymer transport system component